MLLFFFESPAVKLGTQCGPDWNLAAHKSSATRWWIGGRKSEFTFLQPPWHKQRDVFWIVRVSLRKRGLGKRRPSSLQDRTDPAFRSAFIQHELSLVALSYLWIDDWHSWPLLPRGWDALRKSQSCVFIQLLYILKWAPAPLHTRYLCFCRPDQETNAIWSQSAWRNLMSCCDRNCILLHGHYSLSSCLRLETHLNSPLLSYGQVFSTEGVFSTDAMFYSSDLVCLATIPTCIVKCVETNIFYRLPCALVHLSRTRR